VRGEGGDLNVRSIVSVTVDPIQNSAHDGNFAILRWKCYIKISRLQYILSLPFRLKRPVETG